MRLVSGLLFAVLLGHAVLASSPAAVVNDATPVIPNAWLEKRITVAEAEATHRGIRDDRVKRFPDAAKPFGFGNREWEELKGLMMPGDQIWTFSSPPDSWRDLAGRAGVALVRNGVPVRVVVTVMN